MIWQFAATVVEAPDRRRAQVWCIPPALGSDQVGYTRAMIGESATRSVRGQVLVIRQFAATVVEGPDRGVRAVASDEDGSISVGTSEGNELRLTDGSVSRHHCTIRAAERGLEVRDLGSTNGTFLGDTEIRHAYIANGARIRLGTSTVVVALLDHEVEHPLADGDRYGDLIGGSPAVRRLYSLIERYATSPATVLVEGETGTGKELVAEAIHRASPRRDGPFVVVDCGALPRNLVESELFGHVKGAFTGADAARAGAFESAAGGTLLLDEIGELPLAVQPVLLRALENRTIRRLGANVYRPIDVRVLAATHRDLRALVNHKRFRADLFYRLNILHLAIPPLRERPGDIALLVEQFWRALRPDDTPPAELVADFAAQSWPGNVRELRNAVERAICVGPTTPHRVEGERSGDGAIDREIAMSYGDAKEEAMRAWSHDWARRLVAAHGGNLSSASRAARMGRSKLRELLREVDDADERGHNEQDHAYEVGA